MALDDNVFGGGGDDDNSTIPPQSILNDLITQRMPEVAAQDGSVDPQTVLNRLIRRAGSRTSAPQQTPAADFSQFGKTKEELGPNAGADGTDFSQFGEPEEGTEANPHQGTVEVPDTGNAVSVGAESAARSATTQVGQTMKMAARGLPAMEQAEEGAFSPLNENLLTNPPKAEEQGVYKTGQAVTDFGKQIGPTPQEEAAHPIASMVGGAVGGMAAPLALGALSPAAGIAGGAALFGASSAEDTYEEAKKHGADDATASEAALLSGAANAALGSLPIASVLQPVEKILPQASGYVMQILAQAAKDGIVFTGVGEAQQYIGEQIAKMYDPKAGYSFDTERLISEFLAGGALGGLHAAFRRGEAEEQVQPQTGAQPGTGTAQPNAGALPRPGGGGEQTATQTDANNPKYWQENGSFDYAAYQKDNPGYDRNADPNPWQQGAGAQQGGAGAQQGPTGTQQTSPNTQQAAPPPFQTNLNPKLRSKLEQKAAYYKEFSAADIASWDDDKLKDYVNEKFGGGSARPSDDDILRQSGMSDEEIKGMSPEEKTAAASAAVQNGQFHTETRPGTAKNPIDLKTTEDVARAAAVASQDHTPAQGEANNVQRGHATWNGLDITIEVPPGGVRRGTVKGTDQTWEATHPDAYGEFQGLPDAGDGMKPDVIVGSHPNAPTVYVIDELDRKTGAYKQSKAFIGFSTPQDVANSYLGISTKQPGQIGGMRAFGRDEFVKWAKAGGLSKPASGAMKARASGATYNVGAKPGTAASATRDEVSVEPTANAPSVRDHQAIEDALRQVGVDPRHVRPVDIQRAAEIHANEGYSPQDAFQLAVTRAAVEDGLMTTQDVKDDHNEEVAAAVESGLTPERDVRAPTRGAATGGETAEGAEQQLHGGGENGAPRGNEAAAHTENEEPVRPAAGEAAELHGEAAGAGRAETERGGAGQRPTGGERAAEANGRPEREAANRNAPEHEPAGTAAQAALIGGEHTVTAADGAKIKVKPEVVEAKNLITSSDKGYDKTLQPRQRDRAASHAQIREIVTNLDPERLGYSAEADRGAPIVGPDRMVESGNGRVAALRVIYRANPAKAKAYKTWLESQGVDVAKYKEPILVRQRVTELGHEERKAFTVAANKPATLEMSAPERAIADADAITPHMLDLIKDGDLGSLENRGFVRAFVGTMPASERGNLATTEGGLSSAGLSRVRNAVLAKAFGDPDIISRITESTDDDVKSISNALVSAAPAWAKMRSDIEAGTVPEELDLTKALVEAVHRTADMRAKGQKLDEYLAQRDAFDQIKPDVDGFIRNFYDPGGKRAKSAARIADFLRIYANEAAKVSAEAGLDLGLPKVTPHDIQAAASAKSAPAGNRVRPSEQNERPPKRGRGTGEGGAAASAEQLPGSEPRRGFAESDELFASEPGVDNKPQLVFPGAERIASADLAKRRAAEPLRPKKAQKAPDEGLFAPPVEKQIDLEEAIAANKGAPPAAPEPKKVRDAALSQGRLGFEEPKDTFKPPTHRERGIPADARAPIAEFKSADAIKKHPDYAAAKSGDGEAAIRLVRDLIKPESIALARQRFGEGAIYVPVHGEEQTGRNAIPMMMAVRYANGTGGTVGHKIIQANKAFHTGAGPMERLANRAVFSGDVEPGKNYVLVDDTSVMGSTLADLADHIQRNGGKVKGVALIANAGRASILTPTNAAIRDIERRHGDAVKDLFGIAPSGLTADEAAYLRNFRDADGLRASVAKAQRERAARLGAKGLREGPSLTTSSDEENGAPRGVVSDSEKPRAGFEEGEQRFAPPFYSAVARAVEGAKQEKAAPNQWLGLLRNAAGVKPEEMQWLNLEEWLRDHKGPVTKAELSDYVRSNAVEVKERQRGVVPIPELSHVTPDEISIEQTEHQYIAKHVGGRQVDIGKGTVSSEAAARDYAVRYFNNRADEINARRRSATPATEARYGKYVLPGGENYRELLLTLPRGRDGEIAADRRKAILAELDQVQNEFNRLDDVARASIRSTEDELERATTRWHEASAASLDAPRGGALLAEAKAAHDNYKRASLAYDDARTEADKLHFEERRQLAAREDKLKAEYNEINPETAVGYKSPHWDERNVLAHVRFNDRTIDGKRTLFLEEVQSDWHQAGKRRGYQRPIAANERPAAIERLHDLEAKLNAMYSRRDTAEYGALETEAGILRERLTGTEGVPNAPFKTTWPELALKRMIRYAAENGYDKIAWTPGDVQAERYDLSKHISEVRFTRTGTSGFSRHEDIDSPEAGGILDARDLNGTRVMDHYVESPEKIADYIGKDAAEKLLAQQGKYGVRSGTAHVARELKGLHLKVGGEGMQGFYDKILPAAANKLVKKFGAKVERAQIEGPKRGELEQVPIDEEIGERAVRHVHALDITPALRAAATREGFPLFEGRGPGQKPPAPAPRAATAAFEPRDGSPIASQAQEHVVARGRETGNEHLVAIDDKGKVAAQVGGTEKNIDLPPDLLEHIAKPETSLVVHHNHPKNSTLSNQDIAMLGFPGLHAVWAHGHEGRVSRAALTDFGRSMMSKNADFNVNSLNQIIHGITFGYLFKPLKEIVDRGAITPRRADDLLAHMANEVLRRAGILDYATNDRFEGEIKSLNLEPLIEHTKRELTRSIPNAYEQNPTPGEDGRSAGSVYRHPGDVGTAFERVAETPGRDNQQTVANPKRPSRDRSQEGAQLRLLEGQARFEEGNGPFAGAGGAGSGAPPAGGAQTAAGPQPPKRSRPITGALATSRTVKQFKNFWSSAFQPELFSDRALEADPLFARYKARQAQDKDSVIRKSEEEWDHFNKKSVADNLAFMMRWERGASQPDAYENEVMQRWKRILDENYNAERDLGSKASYVRDYLSHVWERPQEFNEWTDAKYGTAQVGPTWFQKGRTFQYIEDGLAAGFKLKYTNPIDLVVHRLLSGVDMRQRMDLLHKLKDMGLARDTVNNPDSLVRRGWQMINAPDRRQWLIAPDVRHLWKNAVDAKGLWQAEHIGGSLFRGWMNLKNVWVPLKLALSAFHPLHVMHIDQANSLALAWDELVKGKDLNAALKAAGEGLVTLPTFGMIHYKKGTAARAAWATRVSEQTPEQRRMTALMTMGGFVPQLSEQLKINSKRQLAEAWQKAQRGEAGVTDWRKLVSAVMRRPIEKLQAPIFEKWIPALKAAAYLNQVAALTKRQPELLNDEGKLRLALRAVAKSIDNRYGEMNYGGLFWNRYVKDAAIGSSLSLGWNLGFLREFGGAAMESVTRPAGLLPSFAPSAGRKVIRDATNKRAFALAYVGTAMLLAGVMSYLFTGEKPEGDDFIFPRIGGLNPDGTKRRATTMFYTREGPMLKKHIEEQGGGVHGVISGTREMLWNKLMFEPFHELATNRDYYHFDIWDENAPWYKQLWQAAGHFFSDQFNPMSVSGARHAAELSGHPFPGATEAIQHPERLGEAVTAKGVGLSLLGFGPAPAYVEKSAIQNRIGYLYDRYVAPTSKPEIEGEKFQAKMSARTAIMTARQNKDSAALSQAYALGREAGLTQDYMNKIGREGTDIYLFSRLPAPQQKSILEEASPDERSRYWPKAHAAVKTEMNQQLRLPNQ